MFRALIRLQRRLKRLLKIQTATRQRAAIGRRHTAIRIALLVITGAGIGLLYSGDTLFEPLDIPREGELAREDVIAPFRIEVQKSARELERERENIRASIPFVIDYDSTILPRSLSTMRRFATLVDSIRTQVAVDTAAARVIADSIWIQQIERRFPMLSTNAIADAFTSDIDLSLMVTRIGQVFVEELYSPGVLRSRSDLPTSREFQTFVIRAGETESVVNRDELIDMPVATAKLLSILNQRGDSLRFSVDAYYFIGRSFVQPNLRVNMAEHERRVDEAITRLSEVSEVLFPGDVIVSARQRVTERQERILREMVRQQSALDSSESFLQPILPAVSRLALVLVVLAGLFIFLKTFRRDIYYSHQKLFGLMLLFGVQFAALWLAELASDQYSVTSLYALPVAILPIMVAVLFDSEVSILATLGLAMLVGVTQKFAFPAVLLTVIVGITGAFVSRHVQQRSHFYRIWLVVVLAYFLVALVLEQLLMTEQHEVLEDLLIGLIMGTITVAVITFLLPFFESLFGFTTDIRLLELSDLNRPLLKRLALEAPGTYHHSIMVGNLCEAAAKAIGGNPLLARVGAYYHDIGKIEIPEYFVENQLGVKSRHENISPTMSAMILASHVKKGRALGEDADLPDAVLDFIEEHHGTMVMSYFYSKAQEQGDDDVDEMKFRYPGPKPQTRETGISMLADAVEASSRTLDDPKPARVDSLIQRIINDRFQSGELSECPLTLADLALIKSAFAQILIAAFHHRVRYPAGVQPD